MTDAERLTVLRKGLHHYLAERLRHRREVAEDNAPPDANDPYAVSLAGLAGYLDSLPDRDPTLQMLIHCPGLVADDVPDRIFLPRGKGWASRVDTETLRFLTRGSMDAREECAAEFAHLANVLLDELAREARVEKARHGKLPGRR